MSRRFWSPLEREVVHRYRFPDRATAHRAIFARAALLRAETASRYLLGFVQSHTARPSPASSEGSSTKAGPQPSRASHS